MAQQNETKQKIIQELKAELEYNKQRRLELFADSTTESLQLQAITGSNIISDNLRQKHRDKLREISRETDRTKSMIKWIEEMLSKYC